MRIERVAIINDSLWPANDDRPQKEVFDWLADQYSNGIWTEIVRKSAIIDEPDLIADFGRYGDLAVGYQFLDSRSRTSSFRLSFNQDDIVTAKS